MGEKGREEMGKEKREGKRKRGGDRKSLSNRLTVGVAVDTIKV